MAGGSTLNIGDAASQPVLKSLYGLKKTGSGLLVFNRPVVTGFTGSVIIDSGILQINVTSAFPVATDIDIITQGKLQVSQNQTLNDVSVYDGTLLVDAGKRLTINGSLTIVNGSVISNTGDIVFTQGAKLIYAGNTLQIPGNEALNLPANNVKTLLFNNGSVAGVQLNNDINVQTADSINGWVV